MTKHIVITSCRACPFVIKDDDIPDVSRRFQCGAVNHSGLRLNYIEGSAMTPPEFCPLDNYDASQSKESVVKDHVKERAERYLSHRDNSKNSMNPF